MDLMDPFQWPWSVRVFNPKPLQAIALKQNLTKSALDFRANPNHRSNHQRALILWKLATNVIVNLEGEDGNRALNFLRMISYLRVDTLDAARIPYLPGFRELVIILRDYGLINFEDRGLITYYLPDTIVMQLHSHTLMTVIRKINKFTGVEKRFVKSCLTWVKLNGFIDECCSVWSFGLKYKDIFKKSSFPRHFYSDLGKIERPKPKFLPFLRRTVRMYERTLEHDDRRASLAKLAYLSVLIKSSEKHSSMKTKLQHWKQITAKEMNLEKLATTAFSWTRKAAEEQLIGIATTLHDHTLNYFMSDDLTADYLREGLKLAQLILKHTNSEWVGNISRIYLIICKCLIELGEEDKIPDFLYDCYGRILMNRACLSIVDPNTDDYSWIELCESVMKTADEFPEPLSLSIFAEVLPILNELQEYNMTEGGFDRQCCVKFTKVVKLHVRCLKQIGMFEEVADVFDKYSNKMMSVIA